MVKTPIKPQASSNIPPNSPNLISKLDSKLSKSRQEINQNYYQKHKEKLKLQRRNKYQQQKLQAELTAQQQSSKYYGAEAIKVLMSFKEYTELNQQKQQLWLDFNWTLQDCQETIKEGFGDIVSVMKLEQVASNLIRDYWTTARKEIRKGKNWNSLSEEQQQRLIRYWGYEKARVENNYLTEEEKLARKSQEYLKDMELAKFHEERGKIKCPCYSCEAKETIRKEVKGKIDKELKELEQAESEKGECNECGKVRVLDEENGLCRQCLKNYEG